MCLVLRPAIPPSASLTILLMILSLEFNLSRLLAPTRLLRRPILSFVDATVPHIWSPLEACEAFEKAFGITYDAAPGLYLVNKMMHRGLLARNVTLVFTIEVDTISPFAVNISLPYAAFDLQLTSCPNAPNATRYFSLRRAATIHSGTDVLTRNVSVL